MEKDLERRIDGLSKKIEQFYNKLKEMQEAHRSDLEKMINKNSKDIQEVYKTLRGIQDKDRVDLEARIERRADSKKDGKYHYYAYKSNIQYGKKVNKYFVINWSLNEAYKKQGDVEVEITDPRDKENLKYQIFQDFNKEQGPTRFVESDDPENDVISPYFYLEFKKHDMSDDDWGVQYDYYATKLSWRCSPKPLYGWVAIDWKNKKVYQHSKYEDDRHGWLKKEDAEQVMRSVGKSDMNMWIHVDRPEVYLKGYNKVYEVDEEPGVFDNFAIYQMINGVPNSYYILDKLRDVSYFFQIRSDGSSSFEASWLKKRDINNETYIEIPLWKVKNAKDLKNYLYKESKNHHIHIDGEVTLKKYWYKFYRDLSLPSPDLYQVSGRVYALDVKNDVSYEFDYLSDGTTYFAKAFLKSDNLKNNRTYKEIMPCEIKRYKELDSYLPSYAEDNFCEADSEDEKITSDDLMMLWRDHGFAAFYDEAKYYAKFLEQYDVSDKSADDWKQYNEHNKWADSATDDKTIWSRLFTAIAFFDIDKIATQIARANNDATTNDYLITSADVDNPYSASEWNKCLYNCLKEVVEDFIEHGEADKNDTYKNYQRGRVHLDSILYHYEDESESDDYPIIKIYWTDEESSAGDNW